MMQFLMEKAGESDTPQAHLYVYGEIVDSSDRDWGYSPIQLQEELDKLDGAALTVHIDSVGGDVSAGLSIYNTLLTYPGEVKTITEGFACSAASVIFMAGDMRVMREASLLMIHNAWTLAMGNAGDLRKAADDLDKINQVVRSIYQRYVSIGEDELQALLDNESWIQPQEAVDYGFATAIAADERKPAAAASAFQAIFNAVTAKKPEPEPAKTPFQRYFHNFK